MLSNVRKKLYDSVVKFMVKKEEGATAVEYGIMVAAIAAVIVTIVFSIGGKVQTAFQSVDTALGGS